MPEPEPPPAPEDSPALLAALERLRTAPAIAYCPGCKAELVWYLPEERWARYCFTCQRDYEPTEFGRLTRHQRHGGRRLSDLLPGGAGAGPMKPAPGGAASRPPTHEGGAV